MEQGWSLEAGMRDQPGASSHPSVQPGWPPLIYLEGKGTWSPRLVSCSQQEAPSALRQLLAVVSSAAM